MPLTGVRCRVGCHLGLILAGTVAMVLAGRRTPHLVWNVTASAPVGLYVVLPAGDPVRGQLVLAKLPAPVARFAAAREYLPLGVPVVKKIAGLSGDVICGRGNSLFINGRWAAHRRSRDGLGRPLPLWRGCRRLSAQQLLLLMANKRSSFDSRYFGPVRRSAILGRLVPLWLG